MSAATRPRWFDPSDERGCRAAWSRLAEPGDRAAGELVHRLGAAAALDAVLGGAAGPSSARWLVRLADVDPHRDLATLTRLGGRLLVPGDEEWPERLDRLGERRPFCLWVRGPGGLARLTERSVALVGARAATGYGEYVAAELAAGCAERGITVVSGAAYGIDGAAHRAAVDAGGTSVAVLACGVDRAYPRGHEQLIDRLARTGLVVSEVPPGSAPTRWRFVERNRLIAVLGCATVVVEAAWRSGALITAREAEEHGCPVAAVPGPVTQAGSAGCHRLLRLGATCVTDAAEVAELITPLTVAAPGPEREEGYLAAQDGLDPLDLRVFDAVPLRQAAAVTSVARAAGLDPQSVTAALGRLELRGLVRCGAGRWRREPATRDPAATRRRAGRGERGLR